MSKFLIPAAAASCSLCLFATVAVSQQAPEKPQMSELFQQIDEPKPRGGYIHGFGKVRKVTADEYAAFQRVIDLGKLIAEASEALADAESNEQRAEAERQLREAVAEQFDQIVKQREAQIAELQARLQQLNQQLEERRAAKDEIVGLRVQVLIKEAKGLGFFPGQSDERGKARSKGTYGGLFERRLENDDSALKSLKY